MKKIVCLTAFTLIVMLICAFVAKAQEMGVRADYARYVKLFETEKEPDLATDVAWRGAYSRNNWKKYAEGTELKDPMPEAEVLMGLYSLATVERKLIYQIEQLVIDKKLLDKTLAETRVLAQIGEFIENDPAFANATEEGFPLRTDAALMGDFRGISFGMQKILKKNMVGDNVPQKVATEVKATVNLFRPEVRGGWEAKYRAIREQITALDALADSFAFNWSAERKKKEMDHLMENAMVQKRAEARAKLEIEARPGKLSIEETQEIKGRALQDVATEELNKMVAKHTAHKYIIGVYQGMDYHVRDLEQIYRYYLDAANQGNPLAQYHIVLFLSYFGDILEMKKEDIQQQCQHWLDEAYRSNSDLAKNRVVELNTQLVADDEKIKKRSEVTAKKIATLVQMEHDKIDMLDNVVIQRAKENRRINELQKRMIEEMERDKERWSELEMERIQAWAKTEATRLESRRPIIVMPRR
jgi:hypothetical protein